MMRAVEYAARLGFRLDDDAADAIFELHSEIRRAAPARIAYELGESLKGGSAEPIFRGLEAVGLLENIAPTAHLAVQSHDDVRLWPLLAAADKAVRAGERPPEEALVGLILLPLFTPTLDAASANGLAGGEAEREARALWEPVAMRLVFSHYRSHLLRHGYYLLARMLAVPRSGKQVLRLMRHEAFDVASWLARFLAAGCERFRPAVERWQGAAERVDRRTASGLRRGPASVGRRAAAPPPARPEARREGERPVSEELRQRIDALRAEIRRHEHLYYVLAAPEITDYAFDQLLAELRRLEAEHPELRDSRLADPAGGRAAARFADGGPPRRADDVARQHLQREASSRRGTSVPSGGSGGRPRRWSRSSRSTVCRSSLTFEGGSLVRAVTRGNGEVGDEVTANARTIRTLPLRLPDALPVVEVRGEVFMPAEVFTILNRERREEDEEPFANPRNATAGSIRLLDPQQAGRRRLSFFAYQVARAEGLALTHHSQALELLSRWGFAVNPGWRRCATLAEVHAFIAEWGARRASLGFDIDGVVIKVDSLVGAAGAGGHQQVPALGGGVQVPPGGGQDPGARHRRAGGPHGRSHAGGRAGAGGAGREHRVPGDAAQRRRGRPPRRAGGGHGVGRQGRRRHPQGRGRGRGRAPVRELAVRHAGRLPGLRHRGGP